MTLKHFSLLLFFISSLLIVQSQCLPPTPIVSVDGSYDNVFYTCPGEEMNFDASTSFFAEGTSISSFEWNFGDGNYDTLSWPLANHTFETPGAYNIQLSLIDDQGCESIENIDILILTSTSPLWDTEIEDTYCIDFTEISPEDSILNALLNYNLEIVELPIEFGNENPLLISSPPVPPISDSYQILGYPEGTVITTANDLEYLCITMEHSFIGDLTIILTCPNGQSINVHQQGGGGTLLGEPIDIDEDYSPGIGWEYCWSPIAVNETWSDEATNISTLPAGTYTSDEDFSNLIGCPVNGNWTINIYDTWQPDNGWLFNWHVSFGENIDSIYSITPLNFGLNCDSTFFTSEYFTQEDDCTLSWNQSITDPGIYPVQITTSNNYGCSFSDTIEFVLNEIPNPTIQLDTASNTLFTEEGMAIYQWFVDGSPIIDSDTYFYTPETDGNYTVVVTTENDCYSMSEQYIYTQDTDNIEIFEIDHFSWNISNGTLSIASSRQSVNRIQLYNATGKLLLEKKVSGNDESINISTYPSGVYLLKINNSQVEKINIP